MNSIKRIFFLLVVRKLFLETPFNIEINTKKMLTTIIF